MKAPKQRKKKQNCNPTKLNEIPEEEDKEIANSDISHDSSSAKLLYDHEENLPKAVEYDSQHQLVEKAMYNYPYDDTQLVEFQGRTFQQSIDDQEPISLLNDEDSSG